MSLLVSPITMMIPVANLLLDALSIQQEIGKEIKCPLMAVAGLAGMFFHAPPKGKSFNRGIASRS